VGVNIIMSVPFTSALLVPTLNSLSSRKTISEYQQNLEKEDAHPRNSSGIHRPVLFCPVVGSCRTERRGYKVLRPYRGGSGTTARKSSVYSLPMLPLHLTYAWSVSALVIAYCDRNSSPFVLIDGPGTGRKGQS
jgi:hypothetical protein